MKSVTRRKFLQLGGLAGAGGLAAGFYTWRLEPHWLELVERPLPVRQLPRGLAGARLAQLSDLHIGPQVDAAYLERVFREVRSLSPDYVVYTGDFISHDTHRLDRAAPLLTRLPCGTRGTFGVLGNHDYGPGWSDPAAAEVVSGLARDAGVRILRNEAVEVDGLQIAGLDDLWAERFDAGPALGAVNPEGASLVLSHNPDTVDLPGWENYQGWILSGHTHGGQCRPPFLPPPLLPVQNRRYTAGAFELEGQRKLYINRGVGHLLQVRFNVRPEITLFHLARAV